MDTSQISCVLSSVATTSDIFVACLPKDWLRDYADVVNNRVRKRKPSAFVVNTDPSDRKGEHWLALFVTSAGDSEWFDSYGFGPEYYDAALFDKFFKSIGVRGPTWSNNFMFQSPISNVCGQYCIAYIFMRCMGMTPNNIISSFTTRFSTDNDRLVSDLLASITAKFNILHTCKLRHTINQTSVSFKHISPYTRVVGRVSVVPQ